MSRRKTNRRHMTGDHHGRTARRATLLVTAADEILSTHKRKRQLSPSERCRHGTRYRRPQSTGGSPNHCPYLSYLASIHRVNSGSFGRVDAKGAL